jgi:energy-coupling factor transporter ATP-binding protein EcfA2
MTKEEKLLLINEIFTPSSPVENKELFFGRMHELGQLKEAIAEKGQHAIVFGIRGSGKTSLTNMVQYLYKNSLTIKVTCHRSDTFNTLWERALRKIRFVDQRFSPGYKPNEKTEMVPLDIPETAYITPNEVENILSAIALPTIIIFDEFDIVRNIAAKTQMADMLKLLSDNLPQITVIIAGMAQNIEKLIGDNQSLERCIRQVELPLMSDDETRELIVENMHIFGLNIKQDVLTRMIDLSSGFPNYMHLLGKFAAIQAVAEGNTEVGEPEFQFSVRKSIENIDLSIRNAFNKATSQKGGPFSMEEVLHACARAQTDHNHSFGIGDVSICLNKITGKDHDTSEIARSLKLLCQREKAEILAKLSRHKNARFIFRKPLLKAFVKFKVFHTSYSL